MGAIKSAFDIAFRDYNTAGVPASGAYPPAKLPIRGIGDTIEAELELVQAAWPSGGYKPFSTKAAMDAAVATIDEGNGAAVYSDSTVGNNGVYKKTTGVMVKVANHPGEYGGAIHLFRTGASTADAIVTIPGDNVTVLEYRYTELYFVQTIEANATTTPTLKVGSLPALVIRDQSGDELPIDAWGVLSTLFLRWDTGTNNWRLLAQGPASGGAGVVINRGYVTPIEQTNADPDNIVAVPSANFAIIPGASPPTMYVLYAEFVNTKEVGLEITGWNTGDPRFILERDGSLLKAGRWAIGDPVVLIFNFVSAAFDIIWPPDERPAQLALVEAQQAAAVASSAFALADDLSQDAVSAVIVVGAEVANVRAITIQLVDANAADVTTRRAVQIAVLADANGDAFVATGGSTGIAIGTDGALLAVVAKKLFMAISEADGDIDLTWTDTGTEVAYLAVILPNGQMVISSALTNA